jgi:ABC-type transport system substrate-binding protein
VSNVWPMSPCYSNLVYFNPSKPLENADTVIPELAERWSWQEGRPFTSRDAKYTFVVREAPDAPAKLRLSPRKDWYANVEAVEAPETHTMVFRLKRPQPAFVARGQSLELERNPDYFIPDRRIWTASSTSPFHNLSVRRAVSPSGSGA